MTEGAPALTVVIPAYQEAARIGPSLVEVERFLAARAETWEVIVVDDGSVDATASLVEEFVRSRPRFTLVRLPENRGKGAAVREGMSRSRGARVLFSDADLSTPLEELDVLDRELERGADLVLASRAVRGARLEVRQPWYRERMGKLFNVCVRLVTGIPFQDTQCGFKLLRGEVARPLAADMREDGFSFDVELVLLARGRGLDVREVPVRWHDERGSRVSPIRDAAAMLASLPRILRRTGRWR